MGGRASTEISKHSTNVVTTALTSLLAGQKLICGEFVSTCTEERNTPLTCTLCPGYR